MDKLNSLYNVNEDRAQTGLHSGLFVKKSDEEKYYLFMPGTTTPFLGGDYDTVEIDILQSDTKGKLFGKMSIDDEDVDFMLHRDNVIRIESFVGQTLDFLSVTADGLGYKSTGTVKYAPNDAEGGEAHTGTFTIAATFVSKVAVIDVRPLIEDTVLFSNAIPDSLDLSDGDQTVTIESYISGYTIAAEVKDNTGLNVTTFTATVTQPTGTSGKVVFKSNSTSSGDTYACAYITLSKTGCASWTKTILLEKH